MSANQCSLGYRAVWTCVTLLHLLDWYCVLLLISSSCSRAPFIFLKSHILNRTFNTQANKQTSKGASTRSYTRLFHLVLLYVYDLLSLVHVQKYVCVYEYDVLQPCWIFCSSYTCTTYKCTSLLYSDELIIIAGVSNQMVFLLDIHHKLFYILIFSIKHVKKAKLWSVEDCR